jgi:DNA-binding beta-propeller fold protein YncE
MRLLARLDRPRRAALALSAALVAGGVLIVLLGPEAEVPVPSAPAASGDIPSLSYVRSLPDAGDEDFVRPVGLALGGNRLYVSDSGAAVVRVFSTAGYDEGKIGQGVLRVPAYLASDEATGTLYVADRELHAVVRFSSEGEALDELRPAVDGALAWEPLGVAVDGEGSVAVTDSSGRHRMLVLDRNGTVQFSLGSLDASGTPGSVGVALDFPNSVAFSADEIWVSDSNNRRVLVFDREGSLIRLISVDGLARGLTFLSDGPGEESYVAVVDALTSEIVLLDAAGEEVTRYGQPGTSAGQLAYPNDVVYDSESSQLFVADTGNARVQVWRVAWPGDSTGIAAVVEALRLSAPQILGAGFVLSGLVAAAIALWPERRR